jgi:tetratricopeptide (TPR) repeat protein
MKRPQRYLFIIMTVLVAVYLLLTRLPPAAALALLVLLVLYVLVLVVWGRDLFFARRHAKRREWAKAQERFERFEKKLLRARWHRLAVVLYPSIYSLDGVAIARNNIAQVLINADDLDRAVQWLRSALQRDPFYPVPYVNLSLIAARRLDEAAARREMTRAVQLGFDPAAARRILHRALTDAESRADDRKR